MGIQTQVNEEDKRTLKNQNNNLNDLNSIEQYILQQVGTIEKNTEDRQQLANITEDLQVLFANLGRNIERSNQEQVLKIRMHQLALCKIMVFTHGKSDFRLLSSHFRLGCAYLQYQCYQQAIDHLTVAIKKNVKMSEIKETKLYHSFMLTFLSRCYYEQGSYEDALEILHRAFQIQQSFKSNSKKPVNNQETIDLISKCYLKLKNYKYLLEFLDKSIDALKKSMGGEPSDDIISKIKQKSKIYAEEGNIQNAMEQIKIAIEYYIRDEERYSIQLIESHQMLADYLEKFGDFEEQLKSLLQMEHYYNGRIRRKSETDRGDKESNDKVGLLKTKRLIANILNKQLKLPEAIKKLQEAQKIQQELFDKGSCQVQKTIRLLGIMNLNNGNLEQADRKLQELSNEESKCDIISAKNIKRRIQPKQNTKASPFRFSRS